MLENILTILIVVFGGITGMVFAFPTLFAMFDSPSYLPFGIGTILGVIASFLLAYGLKFHT